MAETQRSFKDIVDQIAGKEPDPVVYDFRREGNKKGNFTEPADQTGHGVYDTE